MTTLPLNTVRYAAPTIRPPTQFALLALTGVAILIPMGIAGIHGVFAALTLAACLTFVLNVSVKTELRTILAVLGLAAISLVSATVMLSVMSGPACAVYAPAVATIFWTGTAALWTRFYLRK